MKYLILFLSILSTNFSISATEQVNCFITIGSRLPDHEKAIACRGATTIFPQNCVIALSSSRLPPQQLANLCKGAKSNNAVECFRRATTATQMTDQSAVDLCKSDSHQ